jgi:hypothetical protein
MTKRLMQRKVEQLQSHFDGDNANPNETGEWSEENLAKNRRKYYEREAPWILENMTCSEWYDKMIKPTLMQEAA